MSIDSGENPRHWQLDSGEMANEYPPENMFDLFPNRIPSDHYLNRKYAQDQMEQLSETNSISSELDFANQFDYDKYRFSYGDYGQRRHFEPSFTDHRDQSLTDGIRGLSLVNSASHSAKESHIPYMPYRSDSKIFQHNRFKDNYNDIRRFELSDDVRTKIEILYQASHIFLCIEI